jgi:hypothetical protein
VEVMGYINSFLNVQPILLIWIKFQLVTGWVCDCLHIVGFIANILYKIFASSFLKDTELYFFFVVISLSGFDIRAILASKNGLGITLLLFPGEEYRGLMPSIP